MRTISEKPNRIIPTPNPNPESVLSAKRDLQELCQIKHFENSPFEISTFPQTTNQEYGFDQELLVNEQFTSWLKFSVEYESIEEVLLSERDM